MIWYRVNEEISITERQMKVLGLISEGKTNKEIAEELKNSVHTIKFDITKLSRKIFGENSEINPTGTRVKLCRWYMENKVRIDELLELRKKYIA